MMLIHTKPRTNARINPNITNKYKHLKFKVNKCFAKYNEDSNDEEIKVLVADLVEPYAVWLKE